MRKLLASTTIAASLIGAGFGAIALAPTIATAQDEITGEHEQVGGWVAEALGALVDDGTLTQAQADAVGDALEAARPERGDFGGPGFGGRGGFGDHDILEGLGLDPAVVREGLMAGQSLGEIAEANGVSTDELTQAIVDQMTERLDAAVADGHLTQAEADEKLADLTERATAIVSGEADFGPGMRHGHGGPFGDHDGPFGQRDSDGDAEETAGA